MLARRLPRGNNRTPTNDIKKTMIMALILSRSETHQGTQCRCKRCAGQDLRCHCISCGPHRAITRAAGLDGGLFFGQRVTYPCCRVAQGELIYIGCLLCGEGNEGCQCSRLVGCWDIIMIFLALLLLIGVLGCRIDRTRANMRRQTNLRAGICALPCTRARGVKQV